MKRNLKVFYTIIRLYIIIYFIYYIHKHLTFISYYRIMKGKGDNILKPILNLYDLLFSIFYYFGINNAELSDIIKTTIKVYYVQSVDYCKMKLHSKLFLDRLKIM